MRLGKAPKPFPEIQRIKLENRAQEIELANEVADSLRDLQKEIEKEQSDRELSNTRLVFQ